MLDKNVTALLLTGSMAIRLALLVVAAGLLLASLTAPAGATGAIVTVPQFPAMNDAFSVRQAHITWLAAKQEAGMEATISYFAAINGSHAGLSAVKGRFQDTASALPAIKTGEDLEVILQNLRQITREFRQETQLQLEHEGKSNAELSSALHNAVERNGTVRELEDQYWITRRVSELSSFDQFVRASQESIQVLQEYGYEVTPAQERLNQIAALRGEFSAALRSQDYGTAEIIREEIHGSAVSLGQVIESIYRSEPDKVQGPVHG